MNDAELRALMPVRLARGALLRSDGCAVGLVGGGAPAWDLRSSASRARIAAEYHRVLLAQDMPIDVYCFDGAPDLAAELQELYRRADRAGHPTIAVLLDELAEYLDQRASTSVSRSRLTVWAITVEGFTSGLADTGARSFGALLRPAAATTGALRAHAALSEAAERARRLADALAALGGTPPPRLLEAEEIARLLFRLVDPIRAARYPLAGALLDRVRHVVG